MNKSYVLLPKFPLDIIEYLKKVLNENLDLENLHLLKNDVNNIQGDNLIIKNIKCKVLNYSQFKPEVNLFVSNPNIGMAVIHTDKSRYYSLNIPLIVDNSKSMFVAGRYLNLSEYSRPRLYRSNRPSTFVIDNKTGMRFSYEPDLYEFVKLSSPILIDTKLPHSWTNYSNEFRIVASLSFINTTTYSQAVKLCNDWI